MEIIKAHYKVSKPVVSYKEIKKEADELRRFIVRGQFKGYYNKAFAIAHAEVSEIPYAFFVVSPDVMVEKMFLGDVIINPQIVEANLTKEIKTPNNTGNKIFVANTIEYQEPCLSFPYRKPKWLTRFDVIRVKYQIKGLLGFKTIEAELKGIASEIFQHEYDHTQGKNIYFESEAPVKWWELIGTAKSLGGTSLDAPEGLNLNRAKENPVKTTIVTIRNQQIDNQKNTIMPPFIPKT